MSRDSAQRHGTVPSEPPELLPGRSAMYWLRISGLALGAIAVCIITFWVTMSALPSDSLRDDIGYVLLDAIIALAVALGIATVMSSRAARRERRAGYTTTYSKTERDLWLLDRRTGEVLFRPGESRTRRRRDRAGRGS